MKPMEIFRRAVSEIGDVSAAELSAHLAKKYGVKIEPAFIPLFKATLQDLEKTSKLCRDARSISAKQPSQTAGIKYGVRKIAVLDHPANSRDVRPSWA